MPDQISNKERSFPRIRADQIVALSAVALALVGLAVFWRSGFRDRISSDAAVTLLLAQHILDSRTLLPSDWYYGNGDLWILGPQVFALPFVAIFGLTPTALMWSNAIGLGAIFASALLLTYVVCQRWSIALVSASLSIALYSHFQREFVVMQLSYGWMSAKLMLLISMAVLWLRWMEIRSETRAFVVLGGYFALLTVWTAENPVRPLVYLVFPLFVALALSPARLRRPVIGLAFVSILGLVVGELLRHWLLSGLLMATGLETFKMTSPEQWPRHIDVLAQGLSHLYGGQTLGLSRWPMLEGSFAWLRVAALVIVASLVIRTREAAPPNQTWRWLPLQIAVLSMVTVMIVLVVGSALVDPVADRYLIPPWQVALVGLLAALPSSRWQWAGGIVVIAFLFGGVMNAFAIMRANSSLDSVGLPHPPPLDGVITSLQTGGLRRGFASHRYANAASVRSAGTLEICDVVFDPVLRPARWVNPKSCADPTLYAGGFFILLAPDEQDLAHRDRLGATVGPPLKISKADGYEIWEYADEESDLSWMAR